MIPNALPAVEFKRCYLVSSKVSLVETQQLRFYYFCKPHPVSRRNPFCISLDKHINSDHYLADDWNIENGPPITPVLVRDGLFGKDARFAISQTQDALREFNLPVQNKGLSAETPVVYVRIEMVQVNGPGAGNIGHKWLAILDIYHRRSQGCRRRMTGTWILSKRGELVAGD